MTPCIRYRDKNKTNIKKSNKNRGCPQGADGLVETDIQKNNYNTM